MKKTLIILACCLAALTSCTNDLTVTHKIFDDFDYIAIETEETSIAIPYCEMKWFENSLKMCRFEDKLYGGLKPNWYNSYVSIEYINNNKTVVITSYIEYDVLIGYHFEKERQTMKKIEVNRKYLINKLSKMKTIKDN